MKARLIRDARPGIHVRAEDNNDDNDGTIAIELSSQQSQSQEAAHAANKAAQAVKRTQERPEGTEIPSSKLRRIALAALACCQNSLVGGLIYGWASIQPILTEPATSTSSSSALSGRIGCGLTLQQSTLIFSMASCTGMASTLILGYVLDRCGPRICSAVSHVAIAAGCQLFASANSTSGLALYATAACLISYGGPGIQVSIVHLANLFPHNQFTALALLNGTISISMSVFAIFVNLWEAYDWITYQKLFAYFNVLVLLSLGATCVVWPDFSFKAPPATEAARHDPHSSNAHTVEDDVIEAATVHQRWMTEQPLQSYLRQPQAVLQPTGIMMPLERHNSFLWSKKALERGKADMVSLKDAPFKRQFFSGYYVRGNVFFVTVCLLANFYVASITIELADANYYSVHEQQRLARQFTWIMAGGFLPSFVIGIIMDHAGVEAATAWTMVLAILHQVILVCTTTNPSRSWLVTGFVLYVFYRQFLFPVSIALITARLGFKYFGLLNGIAFLLSGVAQLGMVPVVNLVKGTCHLYNSSEDEVILDTCDHGKWLQLHWVELVVLVLLLLVPIYDHRDKLSDEKKKRAAWRTVYGSSPSIASTSTNSPLLSRMSRSGSSNSTGRMSYGSASPSMRSYTAIRAGREELDVLDEADDTGLEF